MKLEDQIISLDYAKKFKDIGIEQDSLINHVEVKNIIQNKFNENGKHISTEVVENRFGIAFTNDFYYPAHNLINKWAAFTLSELGEIIFNQLKKADALTHNIFHKEWQKIVDESDDMRNITEVNMRAKLLLVLWEKGLLTFKEKDNAERTQTETEVG